MSKRKAKDHPPEPTALSRATKILSAFRYDGNDDWEAHWLHLKSTDIIHIARSLESGGAPGRRVDTAERAAEVFNRFGLHGASDWQAVRTPVVEVVQSESKAKMYNEDFAVVVARGLLCDPMDVAGSLAREEGAR
jgi:hypothetical protein